MINTLPKSLIEASTYLLESSLYESMLLENRIQFLKDRNPEIDSSHDALAQHKTASDIIDHFSSNADPSKNKQHTQWILGQYKKKNIRQEDAPRIRDTLSNFDRYKSKLEKKDINQYKTLSDVSSAVHPHLGTAATRVEESQETISKGRTLIHDNGKGLKVYRLEPTEDGKKASQEIYGGGHEIGGTHTSWCTAARSKDCMFDHYSENTPLHVIHTPTGNVYQAHPETKQLMDAKDDAVNEKKHSADINDISKGLDHVPNGWKLKISHKLKDISTGDIEKAVDSSDSQIARLAAEHPKITVSAAEKAADRDDAGNVRGGVAGNPFAPKHVVEKLLDDKAGLIREKAASNPVLDTNTLHKVFEKTKTDNKNNMFNVSLMKNTSADQALLRKAFSDDVHASIGESAFTNPNMSVDTMRHALTYDPTYIGHAVMHPNATPDILDMALSNKDRSRNITNAQYNALRHRNINSDNLHTALDINDINVHRDVMLHPNANISHIERGLKSPHDFIRGYATTSKNITPTHIHQIITNPNESHHNKINAIENENASAENLNTAFDLYPKDINIGLSIAQHKNANPQIIHKLANSGSNVVMINTLLHPLLPKSDIENMSRHENEGVRAHIARRKDLTPEQIHRLANDGSYSVSQTIKANHGHNNI